MKATEPILCPRCGSAIPAEYVDWDTISARCPPCDLPLVLDGELVPLTPVEGYPDRLLEIRVAQTPVDECLVVQVQPESTLVATRGMFGRLRAGGRINRDQVEVFARDRKRTSFPTVEVRGFVPVQVMLMHPSVSSRYGPIGRPWGELSARVKVLLANGQSAVLLDVRRWHVALYVAVELNRALARLRPQPGPYR